MQEQLFMFHRYIGNVYQFPVDKYRKFLIFLQEILYRSNSND